MKIRELENLLLNTNMNNRDRKVKKSKLPDELLEVKHKSISTKTLRSLLEMKMTKMTRKDSENDDGLERNELGASDQLLGDGEDNTNHHTITDTLKDEDN